jgi:hypothetical protein
MINRNIPTTTLLAHCTNHYSAVIRMQRYFGLQVCKWDARIRVSSLGVYCDLQVKILGWPNRTRRFKH